MRQEKTTTGAKSADIPWVNATGELWATVSECQHEMLEFFSHRLAKDSDALHKFGECQSLQDIVTVQSTWLRDTVQDYTTEATKVLDIVTKHAANGHSRVERH
jgi:hypothetical protein